VGCDIKENIDNDSKQYVKEVNWLLLLLLLLLFLLFVGPEEIPPIAL
jgi:hypothetical protein